MVVTEAEVIGELDHGFVHMMQQLRRSGSAPPSANLAHARQILDETIQYAKERTAFGRAVGSFQHNQFLLAELVTKADVSQASVDQCILAHTDGRLSPVDAAKAEWWTAQVQNDILDP